MDDCYDVILMNYHNSAECCDNDKFVVVRMSWWDAKGLTSLATHALKTAQKRIDKEEEDDSLDQNGFNFQLFSLLILNFAHSL